VPPSTVDPGALDELLTAAPKIGARPTGADGGTSIGTDTGLPADTVAPTVEKPPDVARKPKVSVGVPAIDAQLSNPAIEKAARAQLYWNLVTRCKDKQDKILPPDTIRLKFSIDGDGYIVAPSIIVTPVDPKYEEAAACMRRELSTATFRAPAATRGKPCVVD